MADFETAEPGYKTEVRKKDRLVGTTRGPSALVNWACGACSNTTFKNGFTSTQAKRTIHPGETLTAWYSTDDLLTCLGPNCRGSVHFTRQKESDMDELGQERAKAAARGRKAVKRASR